MTALNHPFTHTRPLGSLADRAAQAEATFRQLTEPHGFDETTHSLTDHPTPEDYEAPFYAPEYPHPEEGAGRTYRGRARALLIIGLALLFAGTGWLISLLFIAFA